jgi:hypothetical protein
MQRLRHALGRVTGQAAVSCRVDDWSAGVAHATSSCRWASSYRTGEREDRNRERPSSSSSPAEASRPIRSGRTVAGGSDVPLPRAGAVGWLPARIRRAVSADVEDGGGAAGGRQEASEAGLSSLPQPLRTASLPHQGAWLPKPKYWDSRPIADTSLLPSVVAAVARAADAVAHKAGNAAPSSVTPPRVAQTRKQRQLSDLEAQEKEVRGVEHTGTL